MDHLKTFPDDFLLSYHSLKSVQASTKKRPDVHNTQTHTHTCDSASRNNFTGNANNEAASGLIVASKTRSFSMSICDTISQRLLRVFCKFDMKVLKKTEFFGFSNLS